MAGANKCLLHTLNAFYLVIGLGLAAASLWFFAQVYEITSLRNQNHYLLDYNVYWPQVVPWIFFVVSILAVVVASVGFSATKKNSRKMMVGYTIAQGVMIALLLACGIVAIVIAGTTATETFVKDTIWDAYFQSKNNIEIESAFGNIEKKLQCCGASGPRDYKNWKQDFPMSCCDVYYTGFLGSYVRDCDFTNKLANERYGCATVASQYAKIVTISFAVIAIVMAVIASVSLCVSAALSKSLNRRPRVITQQSEVESKKVLL